jgi:3-oxoacyl-[acyl-carrier protein] reductase
MTHPIAIITGASRGLGRAIALDLAAAGYGVALTARDAAALESVAQDCTKAGAPLALTFPADLRQPDEPARVVAEVMTRAGRIDALVNNAGDTQRGDFLDLSDEQHLSGFALKYHATVRFCRAAWPHLEASKGAVVNISGIGAHTPEPEFSIGGPVNSALINFTKAVSKRPGAPRANVVCPGHIETDRLSRRIDVYAETHGLDREAAAAEMRGKLGISQFGQPGDISAMVRYLCSDQARYITGSVFTVDGGATPGI